MCVYTAKADRLTFFLYVIHPQVFAKAPVICVVMLDLDVQGASIALKRHLCIKCLLTSARLLQVNETQTTELVNKHGNIMISLPCGDAFNLTHHPRHCRLHLVHGYDLTWCGGCGDLVFELSTWVLGSWTSVSEVFWPWPSIAGV
jgi:hypothetical protein